MEFRKVFDASFQSRYKNGLYYVILFLAEFYLQLSVYRYCVSDAFYYLMISAQKRIALLLVIAAVVGLVVLRIRVPEQWEQKKKVLRSSCGYEQLFLVFLTFWFILTCALRHYTVGGDYFEANNLQLFVTFLMAFLFFPLARYCGRDRVKRAMDFLFISLVIPFAVFSVWIIWHYFRAEFVMMPSGRRLLREVPAILYFSEISHNAVARLPMVMIGLSAYLFFARKAWRKALYLMLVFVFSVFLILTNSRTSGFAILLFLMLAMFFCGWYRLEKKSTIYRLLFSIGLALFAGAVWFLLQKGVFALLQLSWSRFLPVQGSAAVQAQSSGADLGGIQARSYSSNIGTVGNRLPLYKASILAMFSNPYQFFFGVTPADAVGVLQETAVNGISMTFEYVHVHNFFLQMGVSFGVPVMIGTIVFSVSLALRGIRILFRKYEVRFKGMWVLVILTGCMLANDMLEAILGFRPEFFCAAFYLLAGWVVAIDSEMRDSSVFVKEVSE